MGLDLQDFTLPIGQIEGIPGAGHRLEEPDALDEVTRLAASRFVDHVSWGDEGGVVTRPATEPGDGAVPGPRSFCVVVADATHARVLVLEPDRETGETAASELVEVAEITNPMVRVRSGAAMSDRRRDIERHYAAEIAEEAAAVWSCYPPCELILVASPAMLAVLRPAIGARTGGPIDPSEIQELARDLTRLSGPRLRDELAGAGLVSAHGAARGRNGLARRR